MACELWDIGCQATKGVSDAVIGLLSMYVIPIVVLLVALFILPKIGKGGAVLSIMVIALLVLWYIGVPGYVEPLHRFLTMMPA